MLAQQVAGAVAAGREESRMPEREQAGVAEQQIERAGEQAEAQQLHQEHRISHPGRHQAYDDQGQVQGVQLALFASFV
ncbi:hypothetical protein D3C84_1185910 [compost metagenome]